jgi:hypothetical protein
MVRKWCRAGSYITAQSSPNCVHRVVDKHEAFAAEWRTHWLGRRCPNSEQEAFRLTSDIPSTDSMLKLWKAPSNSRKPVSVLALRQVQGFENCGLFIKPLGTPGCTRSRQTHREAEIAAKLWPTRLFGQQKRHREGWRLQVWCGWRGSNPLSWFRPFATHATVGLHKIQQV